MNICFSFDNNEILGFINCVNSYLKHSSQKLNFKIIFDGNTNELLDLINKYFNINLFEIKNIKDFPDIYKELLKLPKRKSIKKHTFNIMNYARFYLPYIFEDINEGLYTDCDIIVKQDINKIFEDFDKNNFLIASPINLEYNYNFLDGKGFNNGFYYLNFKYFKENNLIEKYKEFYELFFKEKIFGSQPIINKIYFNKVSGLDLRWNLQGLGSSGKFIPSQKEIDDAYSLHWTGINKPWLENGNFKEIWEKYNKKKNN